MSMTYIKYLSIGLLVALFVAISFIYSGLYPIGADNKHNALTFWVLETLRKKSIARASKDIEVPFLDNPQLLLSGGADYNDMCSGCHLTPGQKNSDMSLGLYPSPPNLTVDADEREESDHNNITKQQFWVIKHGIMASGMAAFGPTHDDERIWAMVSFLKKLPELTPEQYQIITARR
jgi:hypothetical protein